MNTTSDTTRDTSRDPSRDPSSDTSGDTTSVEHTVQSIDALTRDELYAIARARQISGRSRMSKIELRDALQNSGSAEPLERLASRVTAFRKLARAAGNGELVMSTRLLHGDQRRLHVRQTVREDHLIRIAEGDAQTREKFDKLAGSCFSFFRGTALLFYRDMAGEDAWMPTVLTLGDVHPGNFGVMPNADNVPIFGVNDFDEACYAPFTWDLKRGATAFLLSSAEDAGFSSKQQRKIAKRFVKGYIAAISAFSLDDSETEHELRADNAPKLLRKLFKQTWQQRDEWLEEDYHDEYKRGFRSSKKLVPLSQRREEFQGLVEELVRKNRIAMPHRTGETIKVKDVAMRQGQGIASLGLPRYYVLIEGINADGSDDLILEFKRARRSALSGLAPTLEPGFRTAGQRIAHAQAVQLVRGDVFFGHIDINGCSFMTRERAPFRGDINLRKLSKKQWKRYATLCGEALAHAHAMTDDAGQLDHCVEALVIKAIGRKRLFVDDMLRFAEDAAERVRSDHRHFQADHALDAFRSVDKAYR